MGGTGANPDMLPREVLPGVYACSDAAELARVVARRFVDWAWQSIAKDGNFSVALSGGSTPRDLYRLLATPEFRAQVDWPRLHLFWGDERAVHQNSQASQPARFAHTPKNVLTRVAPGNPHAAARQRRSRGLQQ